MSSPGRPGGPNREQMQAMMLSHLDRAKEEYDEEDRPDSVLPLPAFLAFRKNSHCRCCDEATDPSAGSRSGLSVGPSLQVMERMRAFHVQNLKRDAGATSPLGETTGTFTGTGTSAYGTTKSPR